MAYSWQSVDRGTPREVAAALVRVLGGSATPMSRLDLQRALFASTFVGSYSLIDGIRYAVRYGWVEKTATKRYRLTDSGRAALDLADMLEVTK